MNTKTASQKTLFAKNLYLPFVLSLLVVSVACGDESDYASSYRSNTRAGARTNLDQDAYRSTQNENDVSPGQICSYFAAWALCRSDEYSHDEVGAACLNDYLNSNAECQHFYYEFYDCIVDLTTCEETRSCEYLLEPLNGSCRS